MIVDIVKGLAKPVAVALPLLALFVWFAVGRAFRPLARVSDEISRRDPGYLAPLEGDVPSEVAPLVARLNALLARVQASLDGERRFTSDAAHELRTPLAALRAQLQVAQGATGPAEREHALDQGARGGRPRDPRGRAAAHPRAPGAQRVARGRAGPSTCAASPPRPSPSAPSGPGPPASSSRSRRDTAVVAIGHAGLASIALGNLLDNAIRHSPPDATVSVALSREAGLFAARVRDQGPGIPPARRAEALGRFTRLDDEAREGSGLGLSIVARIAELHGAPLALGEGPGGLGLEATLRFPAA